ncbi:MULTISPECIES: GTP cyclohydrolase II [unclassified Nocardioides]|uniref:GTP cyclohydrolase II n=1 Tax=unclassified Nocardioides TaxID=2615069 RepID=UPI0009F0FBAE|nr:MULTISPECIES: GTP cyclohydrolase II [unclassified Nocardioides]GAW52450.1 GTP cyclohydrolase II [Nocardioides sp. PD653-B2]GAW57127.1 GTP cyclohydrolase II [Nocardioides sp. PD653]
MTAGVRTSLTVPLRLADGWSGEARASTFDGLADRGEHLAFRLGSPSGIPLVRVHSECLTGDVFGSERCDCGPQLHESIRRIAAAGGYLLYLRQEGRGIGLYAKLDAYALQDTGLDTYEANLALGYGEDERDYTVAAQMLRALGVDRVALLTNNPDKADQLARHGVDVVERVPTGVHLTSGNARYLAAKARHAHVLTLPIAAPGG